MRFLLLICIEDSFEPLADMEKRTDEWVDEMTRRNVRLEGSQLQAVDEALTVRVRDGKILQSAGPMVEAHKYIVGFDLIEAESMKEASEVAAKHPMAEAGVVEIRAYWQDE